MNYAENTSNTSDKVGNRQPKKEETIGYMRQSLVANPSSYFTSTRMTEDTKIFVLNNL